MGKTITSNDIKKALLNKYRYEKQIKYVSTEVGKFNGDIVLYDINTNSIIEIEVKVFISDLKADFKKLNMASIAGIRIKEELA